MNGHHRQSVFCHLSLSLFLSSVVVFVVTPVEANRLCWSNHCLNSEWCIQTCNLDDDELSCLAQGRVGQNDGEYIASFFGCHHAKCDPHCDPEIGDAQDFICCCSGDLCNSIQGLTPDGDDITPMTNTEPTPTINPQDGMCDTFYVHANMYVLCM